MSGFFADKQVVVAGGAGFLGRWVVSKLQQRGCTSVVVPRQATCDLRKWENVCRLLDQAQPHLVIHLAAVVDNPVGQGNAAACFYDNVLMSLQLLEAARQRGVKKMVCLGTASSYPKNAPVPYREEDLWNGYPDESRAPYALAKKLVLVQVQAYRQQYGFNCIYLIPTNLFGPGDNFEPQTCYVIPALIRKLSNAARNGDHEVVLWGSGNATRDFLFVEDCAEAISLAVELYNDSEPVNLGSGREIAIRDLARSIARLVGYSGRITWDRSKPNGLAQRRLDVSRAERAFGFRARKDFLTGLKETIAWYRENHCESREDEKSYAGLPQH